MRTPARRSATRRGPALAGLAAVLLATAACGLGDRDQDAADALALALLGERPSELEQDTARCTAERWVGEVGADLLVDEGLLDDGLAARRARLVAVTEGRRALGDEAAEGYAAAAYSCLDLDRLALLTEEAYPDASAEQRDEYADCLKEVPAVLWRRALADRVTGNPASAAGASVDRAIDECASELA